VLDAWQFAAGLRHQAVLGRGARAGMRVRPHTAQAWITDEAEGAFGSDCLWLGICSNPVFSGKKVNKSRHFLRALDLN